MLRRTAMVTLVALLALAGQMPGAARDAIPAEDAAQDPAGSAAPADWAKTRLEGLKVREALAREVAGMRRLLAVQKELGAWNRERAEVGSAVRTLRPEICREEELERWCRLLPATFGVWEEGS